MSVMAIAQLIRCITEICKANGAQHLTLFGSLATDTAAPTSDIDFVVYGCPDILRLEQEIERIDTLRKIDIFDYNSIYNEYLLEDIKKFGEKQICRYECGLCLGGHCSKC